MNTLFRIVAILILLLPFHSAGADDGNLKVALLGDSMTWIGGDNFEKPNGWTHYMADLPIEMKTYARSGATWTNSAETRGDTKAYSEVIHPENVIYNQALRLIGEADFTPDIIIIFAGANDAWFQSKRPGMFDLYFAPESISLNSDPSEFTSLEGSVHLVCSILKGAFPDARLYIITPVNAGKISDADIERVSDVIETAASAEGATVIRGNREIPIRHDEEGGKRRKYTYDGVHTNKKGAKLIADCIKRNIIASELVSIDNSN